MKVPFFDYTEIYKSDYPIYTAALESVLKRSDFILRQDLKDFENNISDYSGAKFTAGVGNGTDAIWLGLKALGISRGDEVILPAHTYVATADAVWSVGGTPVLVDIDDDHLISPQAITEALSQNTKAIIPVNLNGRAAPLEEISKISSKHGIPFIEDNAQGLGARLNGKMTGTFGAIGTLSFFPAKILGGLGDGGAVMTNDEYLFGKLLLLRNHGRNEKNEVVEWGYNSRLDNLQAAILNSKLKKLTENINIRRNIADIYFEELSECEEIVLPQAVSGNDDHFVTYQNFEIEVKFRDELINYLSICGIGTLLPWGGKGLHEFGLKGVVEKDLTNTKRLFPRILLLPMNQYMKIEQALYVSRCIKNFYSKKIG